MWLKSLKNTKKNWKRIFGNCHEQLVKTIEKTKLVTSNMEANSILKGSFIKRFSKKNELEEKCSIDESM